VLAPTTVPVVTALRARGPSRVAVDLDGRPWRLLPLEAVYAGRLAVGARLDRAAARALGRALRRIEARDIALRALRARDHTAASLERRLADRGTAAAVRRETVAAAQRAGLVDDDRFAMARSALLASRGAGDLLIADDLERHGVPVAAARAAIEGLEPEPARAAAIIAARGATPRTARYLAARGFSEATLEPLIADLVTDALG
jgi:SOS response regulatory protein OraA/RecX